MATPIPVAITTAILLGSCPGLKAQRPESPPEDRSLQPLLELLNAPVQLASNVQSDRTKQPVSITTIFHNQIELSGARNLLEVLNLYVPGFFHTEHQDESVLSFRGIAPDNNSKVLFLLNGHALNTEWFLGAPDGVLQSLDMEYIERIDIVRGPGSVTMGQGAMLGVINVVTRSRSCLDTSVAGGLGKDGYRFVSIESGGGTEDLSTYLHVSTNRYSGQDLRPEGNATRAWEGVLPNRQIYNSGERLLRSQNLTILANIAFQGFEGQFLHNDTNRDIYEFRRDRGQYEQTLDSFALAYTLSITPNHALKLKVGLDQDDYVLHSTLGYTMGGTRETRQSYAAIYSGKFGPFSMAAGVEDNRFKMGQRNRDGNNFIAQIADATLVDDPNTKKVMVFPADIEVRSLFAEGFYAFNLDWTAFGAFRYDHHDYWGSNTTPRIGLLYNPLREWRFRLAYQTGFRGAPGMHYAGGYLGDGLLREQNFSRVGSATGSRWPNLLPVQPEKMKSLEFETSYLPMRNLSVNLVLFQNHMEHVIGYDAFGSWLFTPIPDSIGTDRKGDWNGYWYFTNTKGDLTAEGAELAVKFTHPVLGVQFSHSLVRLASLDDQAFGSPYAVNRVQGKHFKTYPENVSRLSLLLFPYQRITAAVNLIHYGTWYLPGYVGEGQTLVNAAFSAELTKGLKAVVSINNLLNSRRLYPFDDIPSGSDPRPGAPSVESRTFWAKFRYTF